MRSIKDLISVCLAAVLYAASAASGNTLTFQGVTFQVNAVDSNTFDFSIFSAVSGGTGNWSNVAYLAAFEFKDLGGSITGATVDSAPTGSSWTTTVDHGLNGSALGCPGPGGTPGACFISSPGAFQMTNDMSWRLSFIGSGLNFLDPYFAPHLKVQFLESSTQTRPTGDLLSQSVSPIPEPEIYALMGIGLAVMGFAARRSRQQNSA